MSREILGVCLGITGSFENNTPDYGMVGGNSDSMGLSVGVLQWCAGAGSLGRLIRECLAVMEATAIDSFFDGVPVSTLPRMNPSQAVGFVVSHFLDPAGRPTQVARDQWRSFLETEVIVEVQIQLASDTVLATAYRLADRYCSEASTNLRVIAFMFDTINQMGGMQNSKGIVTATPMDLADPQDALDYAQGHSMFYQILQENLAQDPTPMLGKQLLMYAYERARLSRPEYIWDAFSRRATIACRGGIVHGRVFDLTTVLP